MSNLATRFRRYVQWSRRFRKHGATWSSLLLSPIRHRLANPHSQIDLKNGISIHAPVHEPLLALYEEVWVARCYMPASWQLSPGSIVVDIGANIGMFTLWVKRRFPAVKVIAVEPSPRACEFLRRNISMNALSDVTVLQAACGGRRGEAMLYSRGAEAMNSLYARDVAGSVFRPLARTEMVTLDDIFNRYGVESCSWLKLDCEGAEYEILFGASQESLQKIARISMEYHIGLNEYRVEELKDFLETRGFRVEIPPMIDEESGYLYATKRV